MNAIVTDAGASCADTSPPCPIDVVALSAGLPDGVYYAGKKLTPWMSFNERMRLNDVEGYLRGSDTREEFLALRARRAGESIVVRWSIDGGVPSVPTILWDMHHEGCGREEKVPRAFLWGHGTGHVDVYKLVHFLLRDVTSEYGEDELRTERCFEELYAVTQSYGDTWVLARADVRKILWTERVRRTEASYNWAVKAARAEGVDTDAIPPPREPPRERRKRGGS